MLLSIWQSTSPPPRGAGYLNPTTRCEPPQRGEPPELNHPEASRTNHPPPRLQGEPEVAGGNETFATPKAQGTGRQAGVTDGIDRSENSKTEIELYRGLVH